MALTRLQMANEVLDNLGRGGTSQTRSGSTLSDRVVTWLDRAQVEIGRKYDLLFKESTAATVASTKSYSFPSNLNAVFSFRLEDGLESRKLICRMPWEFDQLRPKMDEYTTGRPDFYIPYKTTNTFELFRIPDAAYTIRIRHSCWASALSADGSTSDITAGGNDVDDVIISLATAYGWKWLGELVDAANWRKEGMELLKDVYKNAIGGPPDWEPTGRGFGNAPSLIGEYYNDPFVKEDP
jgi:hypothetical protein